MNKSIRHDSDDIFANAAALVKWQVSMVYLRSVRVGH